MKLLHPLTQKTRGPVVSVLLVVAFLLLWESAVAWGALKVYKFPPPTKLVGALFELATTGFPLGTSVSAHISSTVSRIIQGYVLGCSLAIPIGILIGASSVLDKLLDPVVTFCRSIAALSLLPLVIIWFGPGETAKIAIISYGTFWAMLSHTIAGVKYVDPMLLRAGRALETTPIAIFWRVIIPAALPRMFAGARVALGVAFMVIVGAEMIGTIQGLGALINEARTFYRADITLVGMVLIGLLGLSLSGVLSIFERVLLPWNKGLEAVYR